MTGPNSNQNSNVSTETWPQGGYVAPWSMPQTGGNLGGAPAGQPGQPREQYIMTLIGSVSEVGVTSYQTAALLALAID